MDSNINDKDKYVNLSNIGSIVTFLLLIAVTFALVRYHFYFQVFLHIPIFQFIDASELALITAGTGIKLLFYLGALFLPTFLLGEKDFNNFQKISFTLIIYALGGLYVWINYLGDPVFREFFRSPFRYPYLGVFLPVVILFIVAYFYPNFSMPVFLRKNRLILPIIFALWYAFFESWAAYQVVLKSKHTQNIILQTKSFGIIKTDSIIVDAGRTKNYWFFYNRNTGLTRVIKTEDIEFVDFDMKKP